MGQYRKLRVRSAKPCRRCSRKAGIFGRGDCLYGAAFRQFPRTRTRKVIAVDIAGISPSGLASTRMLEMRFRKHFPFINEIVFFRIADPGKLNLQEKFDLTISTSLLPGYSGKYLLDCRSWRTRSSNSRSVPRNRSYDAACSSHGEVQSARQ